GSAADGHDPIVLHEQPPGAVLGAGVVHGDDPAVRVEPAQIFSGTSSKRSTSTRPRSVIFRLGITERPRKESVRNGVAPDQPSARAASLHARLRAITSSSGASAMSPATTS